MKTLLISFIFLICSFNATLTGHQYIFIYSASIFLLIVYSKEVFTFLKDNIKALTIKIGDFKIEFTKKTNRVLRKRRICKKKKLRVKKSILKYKKTTVVRDTHSQF